MFYLSVYEILYMYIIVSISNTIEKNDERLLPDSIDSREKKKQKFISRNCTEKTNETGNEWKKRPIRNRFRAGAKSVLVAMRS